MESKEMKEKLLSTVSSAYDMAEKEIVAHLDDKVHQQFGLMCEKIATDLSADVDLVKEVARYYINARGDIEVIRGRYGGMARKQETPKAIVSEVIVPAVIVPEVNNPEVVKKLQEEIKEIKVEDKKEDVVDTIEKDLNDLSEAIKSLEPDQKEEKKEEAKQEEVKEEPKDPNELPNWATAKEDPMQSRLTRKMEWR